MPPRSPSLLPRLVPSLAVLVLAAGRPLPAAEAPPVDVPTEFTIEAEDGRVVMPVPPHSHDGLIAGDQQDVSLRAHGLAIAARRIAFTLGAHAGTNLVEAASMTAAPNARLHLDSRTSDDTRLPLRGLLRPRAVHLRLLHPPADTAPAAGWRYLKRSTTSTACCATATTLGSRSRAAVPVSKPPSPRPSTTAA